MACIAERSQLAPEVADNLVPDGLLSQKFSAYNDEQDVSWPYPDGFIVCYDYRKRFGTVGPLSFGGA